MGKFSGGGWARFWAWNSLRESKKGEFGCLGTKKIRKRIMGVYQILRFESRKGNGNKAIRVNLRRLVFGVVTLEMAPIAGLYNRSNKRVCGKRPDRSQGEAQNGKLVFGMVWL